MSKRTLTLLVLAAVWLVLSACSCAQWAERVVARATPTPTLPPLEPLPEVTPEPIPTLPTEPGAPFSLSLSEAQLNQRLVDTHLEEAGLALDDVRVAITAEHLVVRFRVRQEDTGLTSQLVVRGEPQVVEGVLYLKVEDVILYDGPEGLAAVALKAAIEEAVRQVSYKEGIPVPLEGLELEAVALEPGRMTLEGHIAR